MEPEVRYCLTTDGVRIAYTMTGEGPPIVVCVDPIASHVQLEWSHSVISRIQGEMARHNTLVRFDFRGCGLSDRVFPQALEDWLQDIEAVVQTTGLHEFAMTGMQTATLPVITFASRHPELVSRLAFFDGFTGVADLLKTPPIRALITAAGIDWIMATEATGAPSFGVGNEESRNHGAFVRSCIDPEYLTGINERSATWEVAELARTIKVPALAIRHAGIDYVTLEMSKDLAARITGAQLAIVEGAWADDPEGLARRVVAFLNPGVKQAPITHELPSSTASSAFRTILFTDLVGHTEMMSRLGDNRGRDVLREHERITREVLKANGGTEVKTMGDGFMASFGSVTRAVECAIALQRAVEQWNTTTAHPEALEGRAQTSHIAVRCGLNAGEPIEEDGDLFGATVILASRIAAKADGGEILVADTVRGLCSGKGFLFADRGYFVAKGIEEPVRISEVSWRK